MKKKPMKKDQLPGSSDLGQVLTNQWRYQPIANPMKKSKWKEHKIDGLVCINFMVSKNVQYQARN